MPRKIAENLKTNNKRYSMAEGKNNPKGFQEFIAANDTDKVSRISVAEPDAQYAAAEKILLENAIGGENKKNGTKHDWEEIQRRASSLFNDIAIAMQVGNPPDSDPVQQLVQKHYLLSKTFYTMNASVYEAMAELFQHHPGFSVQLEPFHAGLPVFLAEAMRIHSGKI